MHKSLKLFFHLSIITLWAGNLNAQMFSVESEERQRVSGNNFVSLGFGTMDFSYYGTVTPLNQNRLLDLNENVVTIGYEDLNVEARVNFSNSITGSDNGSYVDFSLRFNPGGFPLIRKENISLLLPLQISTQLTSVNKDNRQDTFRQTSFGLGAGASLNVRFLDKVSIRNQFIPGYGFSSASGGFNGGSVFYMNGKSRLIIENLIFGKSIALGYNFGFQRFDLDDNNFDYELLSHTFSLGMAL